MKDWKKQLDIIKQKTTVVRVNQSDASLKSIEIKKQDLLDKAVLLQKQRTKLRRKMKLEDSKEPYKQSMNLVRNLLKELNENQNELLLIKRELSSLNPINNKQSITPIIEVGEAQKTQWLNQNKVVQQSAVIKSTKSAKRNPSPVSEVNTSIATLKLLNEAKSLIKSYAIVKCTLCRDGYEFVLCSKCGGTKRVAFRPVKQAFLVKCKDVSFGCSLCGGFGEYYSKQEVLSEECECKFGVVGKRECKTCWGTGVVATSSAKNKLPIKDFMRLLSSEESFDRLKVIKSVLSE